MSEGSRIPSFVLSSKTGSTSVSLIGFESATMLDSTITESVSFPILSGILEIC